MIQGAIFDLDGTLLDSMQIWDTIIFTCTEVGHWNDSPIVFREALHHLGMPKDKTVVFEDALFALKTAKRDSFTTSAVYDAYEPKQDKMQTLADISITDYFHTDKFWEFAASL